MEYKLHAAASGVSLVAALEWRTVEAVIEKII